MIDKFTMKTWKIDPDFLILNPKLLTLKFHVSNIYFFRSTSFLKKETC